jgi:predicted HTH transcriptional regulator
MPHPIANHIKNLVSQGEHQQLDFKFEISDSKKIARSLVAFANTDGGKILVGVKDNGAIAGVRSEEEFFMVEGAASMHCRPQISFLTKEWIVDGKTILEVVVKKSPGRPHYAPDKDGKWKAFVRVKDQNLAASKTLLKLWLAQKKNQAVSIRYREQEAILLHYLEENHHITLSGFSRMAGIPRFLAEKILINFILLDIIYMDMTGQQTYYRLAEGKDAGS